MWSSRDESFANNYASTPKFSISEEAYPIVKRTFPEADLPEIPADEVGLRTGINGERLWIVVDEIVYDCTDFLGKHPGGSHIIREFGGRDCSWQWWTFHSKSVHEQYMQTMRVGKTVGVTNRHEQPQSKRFFTLKTIGEQW
ncbi:hypothetical protein LTR43_006410 [Exophiala xenobiotica]|nr:hypothetical protein LTR55_009899 [Exophiala xenobiotica]